SRLVRLPGSGTSYVLLEDLIRAELPALFPGQSVLESAAFRVTRDAELDLDDEGGDYLEAIQEELKKRRKSHVVRLECEAIASPALGAELIARPAVGAGDVSRVAGPVDIRALFGLVELPALEDLRDPPLKPLQLLDDAERSDIFALLDARDV